jgi:hypothetical protein
MVQRRWVIIPGCTQFPHPELAAVRGAVLDGAVGPDVAGPLRPEPDTGAVREPRPIPTVGGQFLTALTPCAAFRLVRLGSPVGFGQRDLV